MKLLKIMTTFTGAYMIEEIDGEITYREASLENFLCYNPTEIDHVVLEKHPTLKRNDVSATRPVAYLTNGEVLFIGWDCPSSFDPDENTFTFRFPTDLLRVRS